MPPHPVNHLDTIAAFLDDAHATVASRAAVFSASALRRPDPEDDAGARARAGR